MMIRPFDPCSDMVAVLDLYQACFAEPPWHECFDVCELQREFEEISSWKEAIFLVACEEGSSQEIVGGAIAFSLSRKSDVLELAGVQETESLYMAELFVALHKREHGIGRQLTQARLNLGWSLGFRRAVVRTSLQQKIVQDLYRNIYGFQTLCVQEVTSLKWIDGIEQSVSDQRVILSGVIPTP